MFFPQSSAVEPSLPVPSIETAPVADGRTILQLARELSSRQALAHNPLPLKGRDVAIVCEDADTSGNLFCDAARQLGARVSRIQPSLTLESDPREVLHTARLLGRLYSALEWPNLPATLQEQLKRDAAIPIYSGISQRGHPLAAWSEQLDVAASPDDKWRWVIQAILLRDLG